MGKSKLVSLQGRFQGFLRSEVPQLEKDLHLLSSTPGIFIPLLGPGLFSVENSKHGDQILVNGLRDISYHGMNYR